MNYIKMNHNKTKYFLLDGNKWKPVTLSPQLLSYKWVQLYTKNGKLKGVGIYRNLGKQLTLNQILQEMKEVGI